MTATTSIQQHWEFLAKTMKGNTKPPGFKWRSLFHFLQAKAKVMPTPALAAKLGPMKQCYHTSGKIALRQRGDERAHDLVYCEGYAMTDSGIPLEHAWILDMVQRRVIETTWTKPGLEYCGIAFTAKFLRASLKGRKYVGLISNWEQDYPLLQMTDEQLSTAFHPVMEIL